MVDRRMMALLLIAATLLAGSGAFLRQVVAHNVPAVSARWPAFTMLYTEEDFGWASNGKMSSQTVELLYNSFDNWKVTIMDSSAFPALNGTWTAYDGETNTHYSAETDETTTADVSKDGGFYVPSQWLVPLYVSTLLEKPNVKPEPSDDPNLQKIVVTDESPCEPFTEAQKQAGLAVCKSEQKFRLSTREIIYDSKYLIPRRLVDKLDGTAIYTVTVTELTFE